MDRRRHSGTCLTSVAMLAASEGTGRWSGEQLELRTVGAFGLFISAAATASSGPGP